VALSKDGQKISISALLEFLDMKEPAMLLLACWHLIGLGLLPREGIVTVGPFGFGSTGSAAILDSRRTFFFFWSLRSFPLRLFPGPGEPTVYPI
jgi:hypothetical protein